MEFTDSPDGFLKKLRNIEKMLNRGAKAMQAAQRKHDKHIALLMPSIIPAIQQYNKKAKKNGLYVIDESSIVASIRTDTSTFCLSVRIRGTNGHEPDEEFGFGDEESTCAASRPFMEKTLTKEKIPLKFEKIFFPHHYFMK